MKTHVNGLKAHVAEHTITTITVFYRDVVYHRTLDFYGPVEDLRKAREEAYEMAERLNENPPPAGDEPPFGTCSACKRTRGSLRLNRSDLPGYPLICDDCVAGPR